MFSVREKMQNLICNLEIFVNLVGKPDTIDRDTYRWTVSHIWLSNPIEKDVQGESRLGNMCLLPGCISCGLNVGYMQIISVVTHLHYITLHYI